MTSPKQDSQSDLIDILREIGIRSGNLMVFEAPSLDPSGTQPGFPALFRALKSLVGDNGTLFVPTCTPLEGMPKPVFDAKVSPSEAGAFSEFFRTQPSVTRSHSPTHSVAALGPNAERILAGHRSAFGRPSPWGEGPFGHRSPWDILAEEDPWWVMVDPEWETSPFTAFSQAVFAEQHAGVTKHTPFPVFSGARLEQELIRSGIASRTSWRGHGLVAFPMRAALDLVQKTLERDPDRLELSQEARVWLSMVDHIHREGYLSAGVARFVITPQVPCARWDGKLLSGVEHDLFARVLVLARGDQRVALVACDLTGIGKHLVDRIRVIAHEKSGFPAEGILVACSHTHSAPDTWCYGNEDPIYIETLIARVSDAICQAASTTQPCRIGCGQVPIRGLARSRRVTMTDGGVYTMRYGVPSTWRVRSELIAGEGPVDPTLTVVRVETLQGAILAILSNLACHADVALMSPNVSGDFPGEAMLALERALGGSTVSLFTAGSAGDIDPTAEMPVWGPRNDANAQRLGRLYAAQVLEALEHIEVSDEARIGVLRAPVDLPVRADWTRMLEQNQSMLARELHQVDVQRETILRILRDGFLHTEVQAIRVNDLALVGLPGEILTETGMRLKRRVSAPKSAVVMLANDDVGYVRTPEMENEGGYESTVSLWNKTTADAERLLLETSARLVAQLFALG